MKLNSLVIRQFRNYEDVEINFHPDINIIYGKNAQGKTNLLEAISYLSTGSSFRETSEQKLGNWGSDFFFIEGNLLRNGEENTLSAGYQLKKKLWKKNGNNCRKISEIVGFLHTVVFTPEDLEIVKKGPEQRRHFLNREMLQIFPGYHHHLNTYKKALLQRNNLLKQIEFGHINSEIERDLLLAPWEEQMAASGAVITLKRASILKDLNEISAEIHSYLSGGEEELKLTYESALPFIDEETAVSDVENQLLQIFKESRNDDLRRGFSTTGPHRDDFNIEINGVDARSYGSQGQQRTAALSIKLSEIELVNNLKGYYPILLLDDVLSELDQNRRAALIKMALNKSQIFITSTDIDRGLLELPDSDYNKYQIVNGNIL